MNRLLKAKLFTTSIIAIATYGSAAQATPQIDTTKSGANVGIAGVSQVGTTTTVTQNLGNAKLYWKTIDTNSTEALNFVQPSSNSVIINHVTSGQATNFLGKMNANGRVVVQNDAGVTFAAGSQVNVGALTATTAKSVAMVGEGTADFKNFSDAKVEFNGDVNGKDFIIAVAKEVNIGNMGTLTSDKGLVNLSAGSASYNIDLKGDGKILYSANNLDSGKVSIAGDINAKSGNIMIRTRANDVAAAVINLDGVLDTSGFEESAELGSRISIGPLPEESGIEGPGGKISLGSMGDININGRINSAGYGIKPNGTLNPSGDIVINSGKDINIANKAFFTSIQGGNIEIQAGHDLYANSRAPIDARGLLSISSGDNLTLKGNYYTDVVKYSGNKIELSSKGNSLINASLRARDGGTVTITSGESISLDGNIDTRGKLTSNNKIQNGGNITITAKYGLKSTSDLNTSALSNGAGGNITFTSGNTAEIYGHLTANGYDANGGNITITSGTNAILANTMHAIGYNPNGKTGVKGGDIKVTTRYDLNNYSELNASGAANGGDISLISNTGRFANGTINGVPIGKIISQGGTGAGGNVTIKSNSDELMGGVDTATGKPIIYSQIDNKGLYQNGVTKVTVAGKPY